MEQIKVLWQGKVNQFPNRIYIPTTKNDVETMEDLVHIDFTNGKLN